MASPCVFAGHLLPSHPPLSHYLSPSLHIPLGGEAADTCHVILPPPHEGVCEECVCPGGKPGKRERQLAMVVGELLAAAEAVVVEEEEEEEYDHAMEACVCVGERETGKEEIGKAEIF